MLLLCYCMGFAVQKAEDELRQRKRELKVKSLATQMFFHPQAQNASEVSQLQLTTEGTPREKYIQPEHYVRRQNWSKPHNLAPITMIVVI